MSQEKSLIPPDNLLTEGKHIPFDPEMQKAILGWLCWFREDKGFLQKYETFFLSCKEHIKPEWFTSAYHKKLWAFRVDFFQKRKRSPLSTTEFTSYETFVPLEQGERNTLTNELGFLRVAADGKQLDDYIIDRLEWWIKIQAFIGHMEKGVELFNKQKVEATFKEMWAMHDELLHIQLNTAGVYRVSDYAFNAAYTYQNLQNALTLGNPVLDSCLLPEASQGCLLPGDTTVILAPTNQGKTTFLISAIVENIAREKSILFLTHEGRPEDITQKLWMRLLGWTKGEYLTHANDPSWHRFMNSWVEFLDKYLVYIPMVKAGLTVEDVEATIRREQDKRKSSTGTYFDLIVDDYPDKLMTSRAGKEMSNRKATDIVYSFFVQLALEYSTHSLVAYQTNREGAKINRGTAKEDRLLTMEDASEAYGPMMTATNVLTLNRSPRAIANNMIIMNICKSRSSETGIAVALRSDYSRATTHNSKSQATWWRNFAKMPERIEDYLQQYTSRETPTTEIISDAMRDP
jgi:hypothetical protein